MSSQAARKSRPLGGRFGSALAVSAVLAALVLALPSTASADPSTTLYVDPSGSAATGCTSPGANACPTIVDAVTAAELLTDDVTIDVAAATYDENVMIDDTSNPTLTIAGAGAATTTIDGGGVGTDVTIMAGTVTISGMTLTDGNANDGGAVDNDGAVTLTNDTLSNNDAVSGAGVYDDGGTVTLTGDTLSGDDAEGDGGGVELVPIGSESTMSATDVTFHDDTAGRGGGVFDGGGFTIMGSTFSDDSANEGGGIADFAYGELDTSTFTSDTATGDNGEGGGVYNANRTIMMTGDSLISDSASSAGGGLYTTAAATVTGSTFSGDSAQFGGGISAGGFVTVTNSTLTGDSATELGGAISVASQTTLSDDTLSKDTAPAGDGPGIYNDHTLIIGSSILSSAGCDIPSGATVTSDGYNVESDNSCALGAGNLVSNSTIGLATTLAANGSTGPETLAIGATSSAVDEVPAAACTVTTDERGDARPGVTTQTACDAGAYEYQGTVAKPPVKKKPSAPRSLHAKAGKKSIKLSWKAPASNGGLTISAYHAYCSLKKKVSTKGSGAKTTGKHLSVVVKKLKAKKKYYCVVIATNAKGSSPASAKVSAKPKK